MSIQQMYTIILLLTVIHGLAVVVFCYRLHGISENYEKDGGGQ